MNQIEPIFLSFQFSCLQQEASVRIRRTRSVSAPSLSQQEEDGDERAVERPEAEGGDLPRQRLVLQRVGRHGEELDHAVEGRQRHLPAPRQLRRRLRRAEDPSDLSRE